MWWRGFAADIGGKLHTASGFYRVLRFTDTLAFQLSNNCLLNRTLAASPPQFLLWFRAVRFAYDQFN
jgi:hypothetical protein